MCLSWLFLICNKSTGTGQVAVSALSIASQQASVLEYHDTKMSVDVPSMIRPYSPLTVVEIDESTVESNGEILEEMMRVQTFTPEQAGTRVA
jgi:hypothetical protein